MQESVRSFFFDFARIDYNFDDSGIKVVRKSVDVLAPARGASIVRASMVIVTIMSSNSGSARANSGRLDTLKMDI